MLNKYKNTIRGNDTKVYLGLVFSKFLMQTVPLDNDKTFQKNGFQWLHWLHFGVHGERSVGRTERIWLVTLGKLHPWPVTKRLQHIARWHVVLNDFKQKLTFTVNEFNIVGWVCWPKIPDVSVFTAICVSLLPSTFSLFVFFLVSDPCTFFAAFCCLAKSCFPMGLNTFSVAETPTDLPGIQFAEFAGNQYDEYELIYVWITSGSCGSDLKLSHFVHRSYMECCTWGEPYHNWSMVFQSFPKCFKWSSFEMLRANHLIDAILPKGKCVLALSSLMTKPQAKLCSKLYGVLAKSIDCLRWQGWFHILCDLCVEIFMRARMVAGAKTYLEMCARNYQYHKSTTPQLRNEPIRHA